MKILPKVLVVSTLFAVLLSFFPAVYAQTPSVAPNLGTISPSPLPGTLPDNAWIIDKEVTFIGKNAARSGLLLDWTLRDYNWSKVQPGAQHPLIPFWVTIRNIVYALFILFVIGTAFVLIVTRGRSLAAKRFVPRFIAVVLLVTFSFSMLQLLYQVTDAIQGFFLSSKAGSICPPDCISQKDLFYWSWDYTQFEGLRLTGPNNEESAFVSLLLTKLSALTYYVMVGILIVRKIILWFFIIVSPIFPLLLLYYPVRNTGKIWIGEFFRWLMYAPLFSIFLAGLVSLWRLGIPMNFIYSRQAAVPGTGVPGTDVYYPTAVNILLAGPGQSALVNNSVNLTDTFALYVVALIMLWMVILLPWILLQIFLDYINTVSFKSAPIQQMMRVVSNRFPPGGGPAPAPLPAPGGLAMPFGKKFAIPAATPAPTGVARPMPTTTGLARELPRPATRAIKEHAEVLRLANLSLPTMRDIARFETSRISNNIAQSREVASMREKLQQIAQPSLVSTSSDRERYQEIREKLVQQSNAGNLMAQSILTASNIVSTASTTTVSEVTKLQNVLRNIANPNSVTSVVEKDRYREFHEKVIQESTKGNQLAQSILSVVTHLSGSTSATENLTRTLTKIANNESVVNIAPAEKEQITKLKETLTSEKEKGNTLATTVLQAVEKISHASTDQERVAISNELHDTLVKESEKGNSLATTLLQTGTHIEFASVLKETIHQLANPAGVTSQVEKERVTSLKEQLVKESQNNNELATLILSTSQKEASATEIQTVHDKLIQARNAGDPLATSIMAMLEDKQLSEQSEKIKEQLAVAKEKGDPLAVSLLALLAQQGQQALPKDATLPNANRIQQVSLDDYEAVKSMWAENYQNLDVPQSTAGGQIGRKEWIQDDISQISNTISLLTSNDEVKIEEGMKEVSNILPFLLIGGFSQDEIVSYLKAKLEAAKSVKTELDQSLNDEDTMIEAQTRKTEQARTMSVTAAQPITKNVTIQANTSTADDDVDDSPLSNLSNTVVHPGTAGSQILQLSNLTLPTMHDIVRYETALLSQKQDDHVVKVVSLLQNVARPENVEQTSDREQLIKLREVLQKESQAGNPLATSILSASGVVTNNKQLSQVALPTSNSVQQVSLEDYEAVRSMWVENYRTMGVPQGSGGESSDRKNWINEDINKISNTVSLLTSQDQIKIEEGMKEVSNILPFLLIGGFSQNEIVGYLKAKLEAAKTIKVELENTQNDEYAPAPSVQKSKTITMPSVAVGESESLDSDSIDGSRSQVPAKPSTSPANAEILSLSNLSLPTIHDIVRYEKDLMLGQQNSTSNIVKTLQDIVNPERVSESSEREKVLRLKDVIVKESQAGNPLANSIIGASQIISGTQPKLAMPAKNNMQAVSIDDYESVKKMWIENYEKVPVPEDPEHPDYSREEWLLKEIEDMANTLALLTSGDEEKIQEGLQRVSNILPFLLIGGFSLDEIISYLKAKLEAAKFVFESLRNAKKENETLMSADVKMPANGQAAVRQEVSRASDLPEKNQDNAVVTGE